MPNPVFWGKKIQCRLLKIVPRMLSLIKMCRQVLYLHKIFWHLNSQILNKFTLLPVDVSKNLPDEWLTVKTLIRCLWIWNLICVYTVCSGLCSNSLGYYSSQRSNLPLNPLDTVCTLIIGLDKIGYPVNIFLISPQKRMLWVLIRSALARRF